MNTRLPALLSLLGCLLFPLKTLPQGWGAGGMVAGFEYGTTLSLGAYETYASAFVNLARKQSTPVFLPGQEAALYRYLGRRFFRPRYVLCQGTFYPLATLSSFMETYHRQQFDRLEACGFNVLRSLGSGTEEPYALSFLLGNLVFLGYYEPADSGKAKVKPAGSALAGLLISTGHRHIQDNIVVNERWWQVEFILTGTSRKARAHKLTWNFRAGLKSHSTELAPDVAVVSLYRDHTMWQGKGPLLLANSRMRYEGHFRWRHQERETPFAVRQLLAYGKKVPLHAIGRPVVVRLGGGVLWEWVRRYDRQVRAFMAAGEGHWVLLIQPSVEF
ncbi:MAG: hypothetical protein ONB30_01775 [candidate division KSB1 bacterium]|nr:hypothetical protein [candidate division KSB1 bacterium]